MEKGEIVESGTHTELLTKKVIMRNCTKCSFRKSRKMP